MTKIMRGGGTHSDYLTISNTKCIKGIFSVFVLMHHLYQHSGLFRDGFGAYLGVIFQGSGYLSVAVFFFLSGYGLRTSNKEKGATYLKKMPRERILPLYCQNLFLIVVYVGLRVIMAQSVTLPDILKSITWGGTIIVNGWYLQTILVLYFFYYLTYGVATEKKGRLDIMNHSVMILMLAAYALVTMEVGLAFSWYQSIFAFMLGILWSDYQDKIDVIVQKKWRVSTGILFINFSITFILGQRFKFFSSLSALVFTAFVVCLLMRIPVNCRLTRWLGKYSYEIYVMQGIGLMLFHSDIFYIENPWLYVWAVTITTLCLAVLVHPVMAWIAKQGRIEKRMV